MTPDLSKHRRFIEDALKQGWQGHTYDDVCRGVAAEEMQAWKSEHAIIITQVIVFPQYKQLYVFLAGGNLAELEALSPEVEQWAKTQGCTHATFIGRPGWQRTYLARTGWRQEPVIYMEKVL